MRADHNNSAFVSQYPDGSNSFRFSPRVRIYTGSVRGPGGSWSVCGKVRTRGLMKIQQSLQAREREKNDEESQPEVMSLLPRCRHFLASLRLMPSIEVYKVDHSEAGVMMRLIALFSSRHDDTSSDSSCQSALHPSFECPVESLPSMNP